MGRTIQTLVVAAVAALGISVPAFAVELTVAERCELIGGTLTLTAAATELLTGAEVVNHLPGPAPKDFGDHRIGTADDAIHPGLGPSSLGACNRTCTNKNATCDPDGDSSDCFGCRRGRGCDRLAFIAQCDPSCSDAGALCNDKAAAGDPGTCTGCAEGKGCNQFGPISGCPNDLAGGSAVPGITCGVAGSPGTKLLHGTTALNSEESTLHGTESDQLSLARPGEGAYSFLIATVGQLESFSYLTGGIVALLTEIRDNSARLQVANVTLGGTTLVPNVFFTAPFNADLITVGPGPDLRFDDIFQDESGESIVRGCNGLALGVDGLDPLGQPIDWQPVSPSPFPKFPNLQSANTGLWNVRSSPERGGRLVTTQADTVTKVPSAAGFFVTQDVVINGYLFPIDEAQVVATGTFRRDAVREGLNLQDLPDIPGFPGSGKNLASYIQNVLAPKAVENPDNKLLGFFRGKTTVEILGQETFLDITVAAAGRFIDFNLCSLDVRPCTF